LKECEGSNLDIRDFSNQLAEATKNMSEYERASLIKLFEDVSKNIAKEEPKNFTEEYSNIGEIPNGITDR
jgi:formate C-acetyltransferase